MTRAEVARLVNLSRDLIAATDAANASRDHPSLTETRAALLLMGEACIQLHGPHGLADDPRGAATSLNA